MRRLDIKDDGPALALVVPGPVIVCDHDLAAFGVTAGGNESRAAAFGTDLRRVGGVFLLVQPRDIVLRQFDGAVQRHNVPQVQPASFGLHALGDAFEFLLVLCVDVRPKHLAARFAEERPVAPRAVGALNPGHPHHVFNLGGEQPPMLETDLRRSSFEVDIAPTATFEAIAGQHGRVAIWRLA